LYLRGQWWCCQDDGEQQTGILDETGSNRAISGN
jgi:hypothetical protein